MSVKVRCDGCGEEYGIGEWPYCPHGGLGGGGYAPFASYVDPHLLPHQDSRAHSTEFNERLGRHVTGVKIESREQRRKIMREQNIDWASRPQGEGAEF